MPTDFRYIPGGICSHRKFHEPAPVPTMEPPVLKRSSTPMPPGSFDPTYANPPPPKDDRLVADVEAILLKTAQDRGDGQLMTPNHVARRILSHPQIAAGLKLLADVDAGLVDIVYPGTKRESSDAR